MAIALVKAATQVDVTSGSSTTAPSITLTGTTGGNAITAYLGCYDSNTSWTISSVTDGGNSYTLRAATATKTGVDRSNAGHGYAVNITGGDRTIAFNLSGTTAGANRYYSIGACEWSGVATSTPEDTGDENQDVDVGTNDVTAGPITTTDAGDLLSGVAVICNNAADADVTWSSPTSWTNRYRFSNWNTSQVMDAGTWLPGATQTTYSAQWAHDNASGSRAGAVVVALKPAAGGGGGRTTRNTRSWPLGMEIGMNWRVAH